MTIDERTVRERIEAHGQAIVAGDLEQAATDFSDDFKGRAGEVVAQLPQQISSAEVTKLERTNGEFVARVRYAGEGDEANVEQHWQESDGAPLIVNARVV